jgi:uncharacterized protein YdgA (DUF945 family)
VKRSIVVVLVTLAMLIIISPGIIGWLAERDLEDGIEAAKVTSPEITIRTERFDRGWFTSEGRHRIELSDRGAFPTLARFVDQAGYQQMPALIVNSRIDHGIVPVGALSRDDSSLEPGIASMYSTLQLDPGNGELIDLPGDVTTSVSLTGETSMAINVTEGEWNDSGVALIWSGAQLDLAVAATGDLSSLNGFIAPMTLATERETVETGRIDVSIAQEPREYGLMAGVMELDSAAFVTRDQYGNTVGINAITMRGATDVEDDRINASSSADISGMTVPGMGDVDLGFDFELNGLDAESFALIYSEYREAAANSGPEQAMSSLYPAMEAELQQLLSAGGDLKLDRLDITFSQGRIESDFSLSLPESKAGDAFSWPGLILKMEAEMNVRMPAELFELAVAMYPEAKSALALGFLIPDGDHYKMHVSVVSGLARINGAPMQIPIPGM